MKKTCETSLYPESGIVLRFVYSCLLGLLFPFYRILSIFNTRLRKFRKSRQEGLNSLVDWINSSASRTSRAPLIWLHGASVGEVDQCLGQMQILRKIWPEARFIQSVFSLSMSTKLLDGTQLCFYLPLDFRSTWRNLPATFRPDIFITMNWDVFPNLLSELKKRGTRLYLGSASLGASNWRLRFPYRRLWRPTYDLFHGIGCVNNINTTRLRQLVSNPERVKTSGDSRFDTILHKISNSKLPAEASDVFDKLKSNKRYLCILASSYQPDENALLPGLIDLLIKNKNWCVAIFPHHIDPAHLDSIAKICKSGSLSSFRYSAGMPDPENRVMLVDQIGLLALAYRYADFCYVGGAFHHRVHNVAEPAALGVPILTGPRIDWSGIATELAEAGFLKHSPSAQVLLDQMAAWMQIPDEVHKIGKQAAAYLKKRAGASQIFYEIFLSDFF